VDTSFPNSRTVAITIAATLEPENNIAIPIIEKYAAHDAIHKEVNIVRDLNENRFIVVNI